MRITIIHGFFLSDSGSAVYVRELAREFRGQGHEVTLVCQEQVPESYEFIDSAYQLSEDNRELRPLFDRETAEAGNTGTNGSCRLVRPAIGGRLLTYVAGPFPGFEALPLQDAGDSEINAYIAANVSALETIHSRWPPDLVQTNHLVMQPYMARRALELLTIKKGSRPPYVVTIHGSALNFSVREDDRLAGYAREGLDGSTAISALSESSRNEIVAWAREVELDISGKSFVVPPGVDTRLFVPRTSDEDAPGDTLLFVGRLLWSKGLQYAVAALPLILEQRPETRLLIAGDGPLRETLERLIGLLDMGDLDGATRLLDESPELRATGEYGPVLPEMDTSAREAYVAAARSNVSGHVHFLGHRPHHELAPLYASADLVLSPSVFPEAFALVSVEAMAAGAIPLATYQTGLRDPLDAADGLLADPVLTSLRPGCRLTAALASVAVHLLDRFPTRNEGFRESLHELVVRKYSWRKVATRYIGFGGDRP